MVGQHAPAACACWPKSESLIVAKTETNLDAETVWRSLSGVFLQVRWRRMRDSNSRGVAPNTLSNTADRRSPAAGTVRDVRR